MRNGYIAEKWVLWRDAVRSCLLRVNVYCVEMMKGVFCRNRYVVEKRERGFSDG